MDMTMLNFVGLAQGITSIINVIALSLSSLTAGL
ncbi:MAG: hypothetical protein EZS28_006869, partial [Streblomastix strix]